MPKQNKTVQVYDLVNYFNKRIERADSISERLSLAGTLEGILHLTGNYRGFEYTDWHKGGYDRWVKAGCPDFPEKNKYLGDESRRRYFMAEGLEDQRHIPGKGHAHLRGLKLTKGDREKPTILRALPAPGQTSSHQHPQHESKKKAGKRPIR